jgi:hypothetical protein
LPCLRSFYFDKFFASLGGYRIAGFAAIFNIKLDGLADVGQRLCAIIPLANTTGSAGTLAT